MEVNKRRFSGEENTFDQKRIKLEQIPVFVEVHESAEDSFCIPNSNLRLNTNPSVDFQSFQCDICKKKFNFFTSFALHAQFAHGEDTSDFVPELDSDIFCEICYESFDKFKDKIHHINSSHYGNKGEFVHRNNLSKLLKKDTVTLNIVVKDNAPLAKGIIAARTVKKEIIDNKVKAFGVEYMVNDENPNIVKCGRCEFPPKVSSK